MITKDQIKSRKNAPKGFQHTIDEYLLCFPCIITNDFIVDVGGLYDILDFGDNGEIAFATVKFLEAYKTGNKVTIVGLNIKTGKLLKRSHCYNNDAQACNWVLTDLFTNPENNNESKSNRHEVIQ